MIFRPFHLFLIDFEKIKILGKREKLCYDLAMLTLPTAKAGGFLGDETSVCFQ